MNSFFWKMLPVVKFFAIPIIFGFKFGRFQEWAQNQQQQNRTKPKKKKIERVWQIQQFGINDSPRAIQLKERGCKKHNQPNETQLHISFFFFYSLENVHFVNRRSRYIYSNCSRWDKSRLRNNSDRFLFTEWMGKKSR